MDAKTGLHVDATTSKKRHKRLPNGGKGRPKGARNKVTKAALPAIIQAIRAEKKETAGEFWRDVLGIDTPKDGKINGRALRVRQNLKLVAEGKRDMSPAQVAIWRMGMAYAVGTPLKAEPEKNFRNRMPYIGRHGLPWEYDVMADQEKLALEAQKEQEKIDQRARQQQLEGAAADPTAATDEDDDGETLEVVRG
jgi:hypothetical protein